MGDEDAATEYAGVAGGLETESVHAWAEDTEVDYPVVRPRRSWGVVAALALAAVGLVVAILLAMPLLTTQTALEEVVETSVRPTRTITLTQPDRDTAFLQALDKTGILYDAAGVAVHNAKVACEALDSGRSEAELVESFGKFNELSPGEAAPFVSIAITHYCPRNQT
jgi:hypothetical protein